MWTDRRAILAAIGVLMFCGMLVGSRALGFTPGEIVSKCLASSAFSAVAWISGAAASRYGRIVLAALVLSWFGDMFLLGNGQAWFLAGLSSFLLAHVAYVGAFYVCGLDRGRMAIAALPVVLVSLAAARWLAANVPDGMLLPVFAYTLVISVMVIAAFGARVRGGAILVPAGATLFYLSDLSVAFLAFGDTVFPHYVWGLPFYYTGQLLLASSVAGATAPNNKD